MKAPCHKCEERTLYCHCYCDRYKSYEDERKAIRERVRNEKEAYNDYTRYTVGRRAAMSKKKIRERG